MKMKTNTFMIDIETLGLVPGSAIIEIAAAEFCLETGEILRETVAKIDLLDSVRLGFTVDAYTAEFHLRNGYSGSLRGCTLFRALHELDMFLHHNTEDVTVWAWGKDFEAKHFEGMLDMMRMPPLWHYARLHCARDEWIRVFGDRRPAKRQHDALADVRAQVGDLVTARKGVTL